VPAVPALACSWSAVPRVPALDKLRRRERTSSWTSSWTSFDRTAEDKLVDKLREDKVRGREDGGGQARGSLVACCCCAASSASAHLPALRVTRRVTLSGFSCRCCS
jgi:hypothetical protein